jgi:parallel beta-helix repeat protein
MKKGFMLIILFFVMTLLANPLHGMSIQSDFPTQIHSGTIYYVGGTGPNNYSTIQQAINTATQGDTVYVYNESSPYFEHVLVNVSIHLIGQNNFTTIIDGENQGDVVIFTADNITMTGFTVQHSGNTPKVDAGIEVRSQRNLITGNRIIQNGDFAIGILLNGSTETLVYENFIAENGNEGIFLQNSSNCTLQSNVITQNGHCAIVISQSSRNIVVHNILYENYATVSLWPGATENEIAWNLMANQEYSGVGIWPTANNNSIHHNYLSNNSLYGFIITRAYGNILMNNTIWGSNEGIHLTMANATVIKFNNFIENNISASFENSSLNHWRGNYWTDHNGRWPKCIKGVIRIPWDKSRMIRWINIDWFPAQKSYEIPDVGGEIL